MLTDDTIHSCSPYCDRPECMKRQRDKLREQLGRVTAERDELRRRIREAPEIHATDSPMEGRCALVRLKDDEL